LGSRLMDLMSFTTRSHILLARATDWIGFLAASRACMSFLFQCPMMLVPNCISLTHRAVDIDSVESAFPKRARASEWICFRSSSDSSGGFIYGMRFLVTI